MLLGYTVRTRPPRGTGVNVDPSAEQVCHRSSTRQVLAVAWDHGILRADDVIARLGLTRSTTLQALNALVDLGVMEETFLPRAEGVTVMGRPARCFRIRPGGGAVVGLDAGHHSMTAAVTDLGGQVLSTASGDIPDSEPSNRQDPGLRRETARRVVAGAITRAGLARPDVLALGIGVPAPVNALGQSPEGTRGFWRTMHAGLLDAFRNDFPRVRMENDASLAALAERHVGAARQEQNFVAVLADWGLGAGVVLDGRLVRGANGGVGELGFLELVQGIGGSVGFNEIIERWIRGHWIPSRLPCAHPWREYLEGERPRSALLATVERHDPITQPLFADLTARMARILGLLSTMYDPSSIIVCGPAAADIGQILDAAQQTLAAETELPPPRVVASPLKGDVVWLGAAAAAREEARDIMIDWTLERRGAPDGPIVPDRRKPARSRTATT